MIRIFLVLFVFVSLDIRCFAADSALGGPVDESKEIEIAKKAKKRDYPGGRDEADLKVQSQVITPARKLAPQAELKNEEPAEE